ncbi:MAG: hypothetical protein RBS88_00380 [Spongiibacteraceae bacterium]|jgi:hypothetical protein|nr:hypothetical protein [Spongiibacteraceae bacterium]
MSTVYVIRNQHGQYLNRQGEWVEAQEAQSLYRTAHWDEAVNSVFEASARDITIRAEAVSCQLDARGLPQLHKEAPQLPLAAEAEPEPPAAPAEPVHPSGDSELPTARTEVAAEAHGADL